MNHQNMVRPNDRPNMVRPNVQTLQHQCISAIAERVLQVGGGRTNSLIDILPLPPLIAQQVEGIYQYRRDLSVLLGWPPLDHVLYARMPYTPPYCDHYCWTNERKIDRRATAAAQLENLDLATSSPAAIQFGIVLASTYCLRNHIQRLLPYWNLVDFSSLNTNRMVVYWAAVFQRLPNAIGDPNTYLLDIRIRRLGSGDFWLAVVESFWPIAKQMNCFRDWTMNILKSTIRTKKKGILVELLNKFEDADTRRTIISRIVDEACKDITYRHNFEMFERLLDCMNDARKEIAGALCNFFSMRWDFLTQQQRARICNAFVDFLPCAIEFGYVKLAICIWNDEQNVLRRFEMLFRDECAVFRTCCADGHLELVRAFWEWASTDQRCRMIECKHGDGLTSAARNGHPSILRYLWENMDHQIAYQSIISDGISRDSLSQLIVADSNKSDGSHELEDFLAVLIATPSDGHEPIYPLAAMKAILVGALSLDNGKALKILVQRAKDGGDSSMLRTLLGSFDDDQRVRLCSKLTTDDDIKLCGLESVQVVTHPQAMMVVQGVHEGEAGDVEDDEDEKEEEDGEVIDLFDEYYGE